MDQNVLITSLGSHLSALSSIISTAVAAAFVTGWAGLQRSEKVHVLSMEVTRSEAFFLLAAVLIAVTAAAALIFLRIGDILSMVDPNHAARAVTTLAVHPWPFNPYAYFGPSQSSMFASGIGFACLIVIWWIGWSSLALLRDILFSVSVVVIYLVYLGVGGASLVAVIVGYGALADLIPSLPEETRLGINQSIGPRIVFPFIGMVAGAVLFLLSQTIAIIRRKKSEVVL